MNKLNRKNQSIENKYAQLSINFDNFYSVTTNEDKTSFDTLDKLFVVIEMAKHPFFFASRSQKVINSRKGYAALKKFRELSNRNLSEKEIIEQTTYETSPALRRTNSASENVVNVSGELIHVMDKWEIIAHEDYGFLDEFDAFVWDFLMKLIADRYAKSKVFYQVYMFSLMDVVNDLIDSGVIKHKDGITYQRIRDSLERLKATSFIHQRGLFRKDKNEMIGSNEYQMSLISSIYYNGQKLKDGTICDGVGIAIDPLIMLNFQHNHYLIAFQKTRSHLKLYPTKSLYDKLTLMCLSAISSRDIYICRRYRYKYFIVIKYENLCNFLGLKPLEGRNYIEYKIQQQLKNFINELSENFVIEKMMVDKFESLKNDKNFNLIFILAPTFVSNVLCFVSKDTKSFYDNRDQNISSDECKRFFSKTKSLIRSQSIINYIFNFDAQTVQNEILEAIETIEEKQSEE